MCCVYSVCIQHLLKILPKNRFKYKSGVKILENERILLVNMIKIMLLYTLLTILLLFEDFIIFRKLKNLLHKSKKSLGKYKNCAW